MENMVTPASLQVRRVDEWDNGSSIRSQPLANRLQLIALHVPWYGFRTQSRLARDSGTSRAAVSRLVRHQVQPSLSVALRLTKALSVRMERPLDVWEVFSLDGTYPTASVCDLCGCRSCSLGKASSDRSFRRLQRRRLPLHDNPSRSKGGQ